MNGNGLGPMNNGGCRTIGWGANPNSNGFDESGYGRRGYGRRGYGRRGMGRGNGMGRGLGMGRGFGQGFAQGRGMGPGRGMGFAKGGPGNGNRVARGFANQRVNQNWGGGWTAPAGETKEEE